MDSHPLLDVEQLKAKFHDPHWGAERLRAINVFEYLDDRELAEIYQLGKVREVRAKSHAVIEGELTRGLFILLLGKVSICKHDPQTRSMMRLAILEQGSWFGEFSLFDDAPRSATVIAEIECYLFHLDERDFRAFMTERGDNLQARFYKRCAEELAQRFRHQNDDYIVSQQLLWKYALRRENIESDSDK